ncbi:hypothetical protein K5Q02_16955 [Pseudomonas sp. MM211]|uniref:hypothetical protein n=1 Tax=Pseudomonas sp. MM211 TaxID=2866808 RepID=UPI001CED969F|nr:hypothetical protein [Pseudomonas sp. MM211]UCJ15531.1 hypothetical protein K5Q02_16955 [Pseudomonas sp. MM211]
MLVFIGGLIEWVVDFVTDVWLVRKKRSLKNRPENTWNKAAEDVALVDGLTTALLAFAVVVFVVIHFVVGLSLGVSLSLSIAPALLYCCYRWIKLMNG